MGHKPEKLVMKLSLFIISFLAFGQLSSQVKVNEEPSVTKIMSAYETFNNEEPTIRGWRIQILTTNDRSQMESGVKRFERLYPHIDFKWEHNPPYYQVRIGAYEKKGELEAFLLELKQEFPSAIPVQDDIQKTEILKFNAQ